MNTEVYERLNKWMNGPMNKYINESKDWQMNPWVYKRTNEWTNRWMNESEERTYRSLTEWMLLVFTVKTCWTLLKIMMCDESDESISTSLCYF